MKIDRLEAHDRYTSLSKEGQTISECCQDLIDKRPFGNHAFYIFAHTRTEEDGFSKRLIWQPRLTKPKAQTNSMLFKAYPGTDNIKIIWMVPAREMWQQYEEGKVTANEVVANSIQDFQKNRDELEKSEEDDLSDIEIDAIYRGISQSSKTKEKSKAIASPILSL